MSARRGKWHPPPAPSPRILHLPRRSRLSSRPARPPPPAPAPARVISPPRRNLRTLLEQEREVAFRSFGAGPARRRGRVAEAEDYSGDETVRDSGDERWRLEAEILRAECKFLRMERELALRGLVKNRERIEASLRSAMGALISGRRKIDGNNAGVGAAGSSPSSEEEMEQLVEKLEELQVDRRRTTRWGRCLQERKRCGRNFDRQASVLRRRLEKMEVNEEEEEMSVREIREIATTESTMQINIKRNEDPHQFPDVETLRRKMEGLCKGMLERMEEYDLFLSAAASTNPSTTTTAVASAAASAGTGKRSGRQSIRTPDTVERPRHHHLANQVEEEEEEEEGKQCEARASGSCSNCKEVVGRIVQQVKAETEQWSEMQAMLDQLRLEMEELQSSRDLWQHRAITSDLSLRSLHTHLLEWRGRALASEQRVTELEERLHLRIKLHSSRSEHLSSSSPVSSRTHSVGRSLEHPVIKKQQHRSLDSQREKEKHVLVCRLKKESDSRRRLPLQDIGNSSLLFRA